MWCVFAVSLAMLVGACGESGAPSAPPAPSQSTAGSSTAPPGDVGGGGNPNVFVPEMILGGAGGSRPQPMAGTAGAAGTGGASAEVKTKIKVLIVDGFNNHVWQIVTKRYLTILARDPIFAPVVSTVPREDDPQWSSWKPDFAAYDVVVQNTTDIGNTPGSWPRETQLAFEEYMRKGGRMLTHHAANHGFERWVEYNKMIGTAWRSKDYGSALTVAEDGTVELIPPGSGTDTRHDYRGDALVHRLGDHPIYAGLPREFMARTIEVIQFMRGPAENVTVLSYIYDPVEKLNFPTSWLVQYGKGLVYNSNYGHVYAQAPEDPIPESMRCAAFETVHERALRWLAGVTEMPPVPADFPTRDATSVRAP